MTMLSADLFGHDGYEVYIGGAHSTLACAMCFDIFDHIPTSEGDRSVLRLLEDIESQGWIGSAELLDLIEGTLQYINDHGEELEKFEHRSTRPTTHYLSPGLFGTVFSAENTLRRLCADLRFSFNRNKRVTVVFKMRGFRETPRENG